MIPVLQATIFSGRGHCAVPVVKRLLELSYCNVAGRLWLVNNGVDVEAMVAGEIDPDLLPPMIPTGLDVCPQLNGDYESRKRKKVAVTAAWTQVVKHAIAADVDLFFVEDDIVPPVDAIQRLQGLAYSWPAGAVSGVTRTNDDKWPFYEFVAGATHHLDLLPQKPRRMLATGTFCMYIRRDVLAKMATTNYIPDWKLQPGGLWGKDCHLGIWLRDNGYELVIDPEVPCDHYVQDKDGRVIVRSGVRA